VAHLNAARLTQLADAIAVEAQNGTHWTKDRYDRERFARILQYASEILAGALAQEPAAVARWYTDQPGTVTSKVGVSVAAFDADGRMLLIQRRDNGLWAQPGGAVEYGELLAETARREAWEESGVAVAPTALLGIYEARRHGFQTIYHWQHVVFLATVTGGTPSPSDETLAAEFFTHEEARALPISPGHDEPIRDAFAAHGKEPIAAYFDRE
jgi:ADP-ribose pyrophosphatase YjhB (NUDIX family)